MSLPRVALRFRKRGREGTSAVARVVKELDAPSMVAGAADGMETKEVTTYGTVLGEMVTGGSALGVGNAGQIGENLGPDGPCVTPEAGEILVVFEALWVLREDDTVLEGFNMGSGDMDNVIIGCLEETTSLVDCGGVVVCSSSFSAATVFSSLA